MRYTKTEWQQGDVGDEFPSIYYSVFDENGDEIQRIEVFDSGKKLYADNTNQEGIDETWLYNTTIEDVLNCDDDNDEFVTIEISQADFEQLWKNPENPKL